MDLERGVNMECTKGDWYWNIWESHAEIRARLKEEDGTSIDRHICFVVTDRATLKPNAELIVTAVNACKRLNPDNPLVVAESIGEMCNLLEQLVKLFNDWADERKRDYEDMPASCSHSTFLVLVGKVDTLNSAKINLARLAQKVMANEL